MKHIKLFEEFTSLYESQSLKTKFNDLQNKLSFVNAIYIQSIIDDNYKVKDLGNESSFIIIEDINVYDKRIDISYRTYNSDYESGGFKTIAKFYGDIDDIIDNLNYLIFDIVANKKKTFNDIKIDYRVNNNVANKYRYENIKNVK